MSKLDLLKQRSALAEEGGGKTRLEKQKASGKMTARERIEFFLDEGTFEEFDKFVVHRSTDFGLGEQKYLGDGVSPATASSTAVRYSSSRRTSRYSAVPSPKRTP